ncbi:hypothetical protein D0962_16250 [Leptolyngbyaceae cyanobacterium CCMR0082]|uniref:Carboxypeptidase regulatory-like domain-containing protein n=1 Tax=Adonisia turfae CCMR0082 TaxID=2304604 RepID=A0A6M0S792_9CYAN|nr:hypothetical protein [Adonisia turfae]NEZ64325.1 hypothetical protein [Adonisia turfae CCMR0082]
MLRADGTPVNGVTVRAYDKDLRSEQILGQPVTTDADGNYEITYSSDEFSEVGSLLLGCVSDSNAPLL